MTKTEKGKHDAEAEGEYPDMPQLLNANHRRALAVTLRRVELAAWHLEEQLTRGEAPHLTLTHFTNSLSPAQQTALLQLITCVRQEIAQLASDYQLEAGESDIMRSIMAEFTLLWCDLEDVRPKKLDRYGPVNPQAYAVLDPPIQRLIQLLLSMSEVTKGQLDRTLQLQGKDEATLET